MKKILKKKQNSKLKQIIDFVFNGKEINGYTFENLTEEEKENIKESLNELDQIIDSYIPEYKDRLKSLVKEKKESINEKTKDMSLKLRKILDKYNN